MRDPGSGVQAEVPSQGARESAKKTSVQSAGASNRMTLMMSVTVTFSGGDNAKPLSPVQNNTAPGQIPLLC